MAESFTKLSNPEFVIWMQNMLATIEANNLVAKIDPDILASAVANNTNLSTNLGERQNLEDSLSGKNQEITANRKLANKNAGFIRDSLKLNDEVSDSFMEQSGFNVDDNVKTFTPPTQPTDLVVTGTSDGTNSLKWKRNGNKQGTLFMIEAKIGDATAWAIVDTVTPAKFEHKEQTPGVKVQYRIKAKRGNQVSTASNVSVVYG